MKKTVQQTRKQNVVNRMCVDVAVVNKALLTTHFQLHAFIALCEFHADGFSGQPGEGSTSCTCGAAPASRSLV